MKVIVCGARTWDNREAVERELRKLPEGTTVIHGDARGADRQAGEVAEGLGLEVRKYPANWEGLGPNAGRLRNQFMLDLGPGKVIAFAREILETKGTLHMVMIARAAGIPVKVVSE